MILHRIFLAWIKNTLILTGYLTIPYFSIYGEEPSSSWEENHPPI